MVLFVRVDEAGGVDGGVDLSGGDAGVAQDFLDDAEVGPVGEEVRGEGVAEKVGFEVFAVEARAVAGLLQ